VCAASESSRSRQARAHPEAYDAQFLGAPVGDGFDPLDRQESAIEP
jgi:hypothetical protein